MRKTTNKLPSTILATSLTIFVISQLVINSILSPLGIELENLNIEKESLVEENRDMEKQMATLSSIKVIKTLTSERLKISQNEDPTVVYITDTGVIAER